jgi:hypothetical protein
MNVTYIRRDLDLSFPYEVFGHIHPAPSPVRIYRFPVSIDRFHSSRWER